MSTKKPDNSRQKYTVASPYQCPNHKHWHQKGEVVELLASEAEFLILSGKVTRVITTVKPKGEA
jgi:hypothetical protein